MQYGIRQVSARLIVFLVSILLFSCFLGLLLGYSRLSCLDALQALFGKGGDAVDIIWDIRLPRVILSTASGMGLALSGVVMQAMFRNPMASPYIMGISSGASLGVVTAVFLGTGVSVAGAYLMGIGAFAGALLVSLCVIAISEKYKEDIAHLLIFGVALGAVCSGLTGVIIYSGASSSGVDVTLYWLMGSVAFAKLENSTFLLFIVLAMSIFFITQSRILNLMAVGREDVLPLGKDIFPFFRLYLLLNSLLVGCIIMQAGLIGFVGLIVPHFVRLQYGGNHRELLILSVICGGILTVWADMLGRTIIHGSDIPIGVMLSFIGAPLFIFMLLKQTSEYGGEKM